MKKYVLILVVALATTGCAATPKRPCDVSLIEAAKKTQTLMHDAYYHGYEQAVKDAATTAAKNAARHVGPSNPANRFVEIIDESYPIGKF